MVVGLRGRGWTLFRGPRWGRTQGSLSHTCTHTAHVHAPGTTLRHFVILGLCQWGWPSEESSGPDLPGEASPQHVSTDTCAHTCTEIHRHTCTQTCTDTRTETQRPRDAHVCTRTDTQTHSRSLSPRLSPSGRGRLVRLGFRADPLSRGTIGPHPPALSPRQSLFQRTSLSPHPAPLCCHVYLDCLYHLSDS